MKIDFKTVPYADKVLHFVLGLAIALVVAFLAWQVNKVYALAAGFGAAVLAGAAKEMLDAAGRKASELAGEKPKHTADFKDFAATAFGGLVAMLALRVISRLLGWD